MNFKKMKKVRTLLVRMLFYCMAKSAQQSVYISTEDMAVRRMYADPDRLLLCSINLY